MKKQIMILMAVLLTCTTAIALASLQGLTAAVVAVNISVEPADAGYVTFNGSRTTSFQTFGGRNVTLTAVGNPGYALEGWYVDGELVATDNPHTFTPDANLNVVAKFGTLAASTLTCAVKPGCEGMGTVSVSPSGTVSGNEHKINTGQSVTVTATPAKGAQFSHWEDISGNVLSASSRYVFTLTEDRTVYAVFSQLENYRDDLAAFPGCEGYGRFTTGGRMTDGRGAKVYYVTRLDDTGAEGSLRWAATVGDDTPRTILFKVAGTIYLTSRLSVKGNTTIAGQTAPGGGICIAGYQVKLNSNTIVRHIRFRAGDLPNGSMSILDVENINHIVLDHCSISWSMEENLTLYDTDYTTTQWCIFSEGLYESKNVKGHRAYAVQWGGEHGTMHHCLFANNNSRSPRFNGVRPSVNDRHVDNEFVNNVVYNWGGHNSIYGGECDQSLGDGVYNRTYMINNYYRPGPRTKAAGGNRHFVSASGEQESELGQWYLSGNKFELDSKWRTSDNIWSNSVLEKVNADNYYGFATGSNERGFNLYRAGNIGLSQRIADKVILKEIPYALSGMSFEESADEAFKKVTTQAGASLPRYDELDARVLAEAAGTIDPQFGGTLGKTSGIIDSPYDITLSEHDDFVALDEATNQEINVTCYPRLQGDATDCRVVDTDGDGLPDAYEDEVGLNKRDAKDGQALTASGYSNLELFLNGVADGAIDAKKYNKHQPVGMQNRFDAVVAQDGSGNYMTVQQAVDAAPGNAPFYIFVKAGIYEGHVQIDKANVHLTGQSKQNTIISWNMTNDEGGGVDKASTVNVTANDVTFDNLTIRNTRWNEGQALALYTKADRIIVTNCNLEGYQDTYRTGKAGQRHLIRNSKIAGRTDFIYGDGEVYFDSDTLHIVEGGGYIVAPDHQSPKYGYVFRDAVITSRSSGMQTYLGRPWHYTPKVSFINTRLTPGISIYPQGWIDMGGLPVQMAEYNTTDANGNAVDLSQRKTSFTADGKTATSKAVLTPLEADGYKLDYMLRGTDEWDADWQAFILPAPNVYVTGGTVSWRDATGYAQCYLVIVGGQAMLTTDTSRADDGQTVTVHAVSAYGVLSEQASSAHPSGITPLKAGVQVADRQYFTADGRRVSRLQHGVNVIRETLTDGTKRTVKVVAK